MPTGNPDSLNLPDAVEQEIQDGIREIQRKYANRELDQLACIRAAFDAIAEPIWRAGLLTRQMVKMDIPPECLALAENRKWLFRPTSVESRKLLTQSHFGKNALVAAGSSLGKQVSASMCRTGG